MQGLSSRSGCLILDVLNRVPASALPVPEDVVGDGKPVDVGHRAP